MVINARVIVTCRTFAHPEALLAGCSCVCVMTSCKQVTTFDDALARALCAEPRDARTGPLAEPFIFLPILSQACTGSNPHRDTVLRSYFYARTIDRSKYVMRYQ